MGNQAGIIIRNVKNELFHSAKRLILNEVKGIECLLVDDQLFELLENKQKMRYLVNIIGDSYLKEELQDMLDELEEIANNNMNADHEED